MRKTEFVACRMTSDQCQKLDRLAESTGTNRGWVLRNLIERAELITPALFVGNVKKSVELPAPQKQGAP